MWKKEIPARTIRTRVWGDDGVVVMTWAKVAYFRGPMVGVEHPQTGQLREFRQNRVETLNPIR